MQIEKYQMRFRFEAAMSSVQLKKKKLLQLAAHNILHCDVHESCSKHATGSPPAQLHDLLSIAHASPPPSTSAALSLLGQGFPNLLLSLTLLLPPPFSGMPVKDTSVSAF